MRTKIRRNPARDERIYEALALIAKRNGADMVGRSMVALDDGKGRTLWLTYEPDKAKRWENADGPFWIRALHYDSETMKQAKIDRNVFAMNVDDAAEMFQHFRQRLWPQRGYAKRRFEEIARRNPIESDPTRIAPNGAPVGEMIFRHQLLPRSGFMSRDERIVPVGYGRKTPRGVWLNLGDGGGRMLRWSVAEKRFVEPQQQYVSLAPGRSALLLPDRYDRWSKPVLYVNRGDGIFEIYEVEDR